jgi:thymidylate kinase
MDHLIAMHEGLYLPNLTLFLDVSAQIASQRIGLRADSANVTDAKTPEYFEKVDLLMRVCDNYNIAIQKLKETENIVVIDGTKPIDDVEKLIQGEIEKLFQK